MGYKQFNRVVRVTVGKGTGTVLENLRVAFDIEKDLTDEGNKGNISIWNLSDTTRKKCEEMDAVCIIEVGYEETIGCVFLASGNITFANTDLTKPDAETTIEFVDGRVNVRDGTSSLSYTEGTNGRTICQDLASNMGVTLVIAPDVVFPDYKNGFSFVGYSKNGMDKVTKAAGAIWSIQNGILQVIKANGTTAASAVVLNKGSGLVGIPERIVKSASRAEISKENKDNKTKKEGWKIQFLINAGINPGDLVKIESKVVEGFFRVESMKFSGDTHGNDWTCTAEVFAP